MEVGCDTEFVPDCRHARPIRLLPLSFEGGGICLPHRGCSSKIPADACMVKPVQVERSPAVAAVKDEQEEEEPLLDLLATLDLSQLLRLSCHRVVRHGEMREQADFEKSGLSEAHAFEDHLYLAEPTRRTRMTRNNACLDLGALCKRARPCRLEETCEKVET
ncbi:hypothetical protein T484DRAFT_1875378 [Baffinella frigidus]|nr:hypothetical protein T484DRAFT_1875378 [Cryptophyta sp. CCMP2293]